MLCSPLQPLHPSPPHSDKPIVWTVAGSDSGGGAGLQADLRALDAMDVHGCTAVAALTAQNSVGVRQVSVVSPDLLEAQLTALANDLPPQAIKTGLLGSASHIAMVAGWVTRLRTHRPGLPLVVDPVLRSSTGADFGSEALLNAYRRVLLPLATLITPNRAEAAVLLGCAPLSSARDVENAAKALLALGCQAVVITGGDFAERDTSDDYALTPHAQGWLSLPRLQTRHNHGTGCVFASSAAAALARGFVSMEAIILGKMATHHALHHGYPAGQGAGPVRPRADFARHLANLPAFTLEGQSAPALVPRFAALSTPYLGLYAVVDSAAWVQRVLAAGVKTVQLRIKKEANHPQLQEEVRASVAAARAAGAQLFINDHWELAIAEGAYGVHLGQEDLPLADLQAIARAGLRLGISTHCYWEVCRAWAWRPSYIACGPIHATQSKDMPWLPQGNGNLAYWSALLPLPVVGIAGMNAERTAQAVHSGASGVAVITAITAPGQGTAPEAAIAQLQAACKAGETSNSATPVTAPALPQSTIFAST